MTRENYLLVAKLTAILRLANAMDRSHYQKVKRHQSCTEKTGSAADMIPARDISLELGASAIKAEFFEEVFGIRLVLRRKRRV